MNKLLITVKDGVINGVKTGITLLKIMLPIYIIVVILKYSPVMGFLESVFAPAMKIFNLPPDAIVPIMTGVFTDEYGVVAAISSFNFSTAAITTIAMIALTAHSLPVESAVAQKIGFPAGKVAIYRIGMAILTGILVGWIGGIFI